MNSELDAFFIVGAPRAGTTAMCRYLKKHPDISFSDPKETHYFLLADPQTPPEVLKSRFIKAFFPDLDGQPRLLGEGSVSTLYSAEAIQRILAVFPSAKFIAMLRDPVDLLRSYHARLVLLQQESEEDFEVAWNLQEARARGEKIPSSCRDARILQYREVGRLGHYSAQLVELAGEENCKAVFFEDFLSDTLAVYKDVVDFLGLDYDGQIVFEKKNPQRVYRNKLLQAIYSGPLLRPIANQFMKNPERAAALQRMTRPLRKWIKKLNSVEMELPPLDPAFVRRLRQELRADIELLGRTFDRDLRPWIEGGEPARSEPSAQAREGRGEAPRPTRVAGQNS